MYLITSLPYCHTAKTEDALRWHHHHVLNQLKAQDVFLPVKQDSNSLHKWCLTSEVSESPKEGKKSIAGS